MKQSRIESFFSFIPQFKEKHKKYFIYSPDIKNPCAEFSYKPLPTDTYITTTKLGIKLYYREPRDTPQIEWPIIQTQASIPLLKSNLQKAIRRKNEFVALQTALSLLQIDSIAFLRRLAVIYIEDVCLTESYPIIIWFMMALPIYQITSLDTDIIMHIVFHLCQCNSVYMPTEIIENTITKLSAYNAHIQLQEYQDANTLLALYYRAKYGGMKCDMNMLLKSVQYYMKYPEQIEKTTEYNVLNYDELLGSLSIDSVEILKEAVDFHPFPSMIRELYILLEGKYTEEEIKRTIWFSESGVNMRKQWTIDDSLKYKKESCWQAIKKEIGFVRSKLLW